MSNKSIKWKVFRKKWKVFDLSHLNPFSLKVPVNKKWINKELKVFISFSSHCFTAKYDSEKHDFSDKYYQCPDWRYFCLERYELSKKLLNHIIHELKDNKVFFSKHYDFFKTKINNDDKYFVFFKVYKDKKWWEYDILLHITSAHIRFDDLDFKSEKISFDLLLLSTFLNKNPKRPIK